MEIALRTYVNPERDNWAQFLDGFALAYNTTPHTSTGYAPSYLLYGFTPVTESTLLSDPRYIPRALGDSATRGGQADKIHLEHEDNRAVDMVEQFEAERSQALDALKLSKAHQERSYNNGRLLTEFEEGDLVVINPHTLELLRKEKGKGHKLQMKYDGPFEIIRKLSADTYQLRLPDSYKIHPVLNIAHIEKYYPSPDEFGPRPMKDLNRTDFDERPEMEVECIVAERMFKGSGKHRRVRKFKVRYKDMPPNEDEWKTKAQLGNTPEILLAWQQQRGTE